MKKTGLLLMTVSLGTLALAGCGCKCDKNAEVLDEAVQYCLDNGGTHSFVQSQDETYGECYFPSGIGCRDDIVLSGECDFVADTSNIDTEEKRLSGCEENVIGWVEDFEDGENVSIDREAEGEAGASFVRNGVAHYTKEGSNWKIGVECIADFVDGSISVSYDGAFLDQ